MNGWFFAAAGAILASWYLKRGIKVNGCTDVTGEQLKVKLGNKEGLTVIDVRTPGEYSAGHIPGALLRPLGNINQWSNEFEFEQPLVLVCASGGRSSSAASKLAEAGFTNLYNLTGGMSKWRFPVEK